MSFKDHLVAILALPFMVVLVVPLFLLIIGGMNLEWLLPAPLGVSTLLIGLALIVFGIWLLANTIILFARVGKGTLAPWSPPEKLVIKGIYQRTRNPMIMGVLMILLGASIIAGSFYILIWFMVFLVGNHIYFIRKEEPDLVRRFGDNYLLYMKHVPRWIPRLHPWKELSNNNNNQI